MPTTRDLVSEAYHLADPANFEPDMSDVEGLSDAEVERIYLERQADAWTDALEAWLEGCDDKLEAIEHVRNAKVLRAEMFGRRADEYARRAKGEKRTVDRLDGLALELVTGIAAACGKDHRGYKHRMPDGRDVAARAYRSKAVKVVDQSIVRRDLIRVSESVDKAAAARLLKAGEACPGLELEERETVKVVWPR